MSFPSRLPDSGGPNLEESISCPALTAKRMKAVGFAWPEAVQAPLEAERRSLDGSTSGKLGHQLSSNLVGRYAPHRYKYNHPDLCRNQSPGSSLGQERVALEARDGYQSMMAVCVTSSVPGEVDVEVQLALRVARAWK